jgi:nitrilase
MTIYIAAVAQISSRPADSLTSAAKAAKAIAEAARAEATFPEARREAYPKAYECALGQAPQTVLMRGRSASVDPLGKVLAGPDFTDEAILYADIDLDDIPRGKFDFDVADHYARSDIFQPIVDDRPKQAVSTTTNSSALA